MNTSLRLMAPFAIAALALAACTSAPSAPSGDSSAPAAPAQSAAQPAPQGDDQAAPQSTPGTQTPASTQAVMGALPDAGVGAIAAALATQLGTVVGLDDGIDDNGEWEVDILPDGANKAVEVKVLNGQVTGTQPDTDDDDVLSVQGMTVPIEAAITKAFTMLQGTFDSADLEMLNGVPTWVIDIDPPNMADDDQKVQINAVTGEAVLVAD